MAENLDADCGTATIQSPTSAELYLPRDYGKAIEFVAASWWRRTLIKLISGGRVEFKNEPHP